MAGPSPLLALSTARVPPDPDPGLAKRRKTPSHTVLNPGETIKSRSWHARPRKNPHDPTLGVYPPHPCPVSGFPTTIWPRIPPRRAQGGVCLWRIVPWNS